MGRNMMEKMRYWKWMWCIYIYGDSKVGYEALLKQSAASYNTAFLDLDVSSRWTYTVSVDQSFNQITGSIAQTRLWLL